MKLKTITLSLDNLIKIKKIDDEFYHEKVLILDWYLKRYNEKHQGLLLLNHINECVGYLVSVPIKKELYDTIINGVIINDIYINPKMFVEESKYNYIVSIVISDHYRHKGYGKLMLEELFNNTKGKFCALTITRDGYNLASKYMNRAVIIDDTTSVFSKDVL